MLTLVVGFAVQSASLNAEKIVVRRPMTQAMAFVPSPRINQLKSDKPLVLTGKYTFPAGYVRNFPIFDNVLRQRFILPPDSGKPVSLDAGEADIGAEPGGYRLVIRSEGISVIGKDEEGLKRGLRRLGFLVFVRDEKLMLPTGVVVDDANLAFRGIQIDGATVDAQLALWKQCFAPLGFNQAIVPSDDVSTADLTYLAEDLARLKVEFIPAIRGVQPPALKTPIVALSSDAAAAGTAALGQGTTPLFLDDAPPEIPKGAWVVDRGIASTTEPSAYYPRLQGLKQAGARPIRLVEGPVDSAFAQIQAAIIEKAGVLMRLSQPPTPDDLQRAVLVAEYAWTGRSDRPDKFAFSPAEIVRRLLFTPPQPLINQNGMAYCLGTGSRADLGHLSFRIGEPFGSSPFKLNGTGTTLALALRSSTPVDEGAEVGSVEITVGSKRVVHRLRYGIDVRAKGDSRPVVGGVGKDGLWAIEFQLAEMAGTVTQVKFFSTSAAGIEFVGFTLS